MKQIKITPTNIKTGNTAPSYFIDEIPNEKVAITDARARAKSGLGRFDNWIFYR